MEAELPEIWGAADEVDEVVDLLIPGPAGPLRVRVYRPRSTTLLPVLVWFHGGGWVVGSLDSHDPVCRAIANRAPCVVVAVDYRLAPEHPYPAADLTLAGATMDTKSDVDPLLSRELLQPRIADYTAGQDPALGLISPVFADLSGLPPLIIQAGTHEVLLDDAVRLAQKAAAADVAVTLDLTPKVPHVFQNFYPILDEAADALDRAGKLLTAYLERRNTCEQQ
jgi:acetyl esterase/lipase